MIIEHEAKYKVVINLLHNANKIIFLNPNSLLSILWYILINENGEIIKKNVARPSEIDKLGKDIDNI
jgi:hypothetical protein